MEGIRKNRLLAVSRSLVKSVALRGLMAAILLPLSAMAEEVKVVDSNGNELRYSYEADGPATFTGISKYSADADKAGHIIIADRVTDANGGSHDVLYIGGSLSNRSNIVSVVFGQNIIATGGPDGTSSNAFYNCSKLESVTLNAKLQILGEHTFLNCYNMESINLGDATSLTTIKASAIEDCDHVRELTLPASVTTLEKNVFYSIDSLRTFTFAEGSQLQVMDGEGTFRGNTKLESINLEACNQLTSICSYAFYNCPALKTITIPSSVETFGSNIFEYTNNIETFTFLAPTVPESLYRGKNKLTTVNIGPGVKNIGRTAFNNNYTLTNINIDPNVSDLVIGYAAFEDADNVRTLTLPKGVVTIDYQGFAYIDSLRTVTFAEGSQLTTLGEQAFRSNRKMESINIEVCTQLTNFPSYIFYDCSSLRSLTVPVSVTEFGSSMFSYTSNMESITFLAQSVPESFYTYGNKLTTVNIGADVKRIGNYAFYGNNALRSLNINSGVSDLTIGEFAFAEDDHLNNVTLPKGVVALESAAFRSCDSMYVFTFADGSPITKIPQDCFNYCRCLEKLTLPDAVQTVEAGAFGRCDAMTEITFGTALTSLPDDWYLFTSCNNLRKVTLPGPNYPFVREIWIPDLAVYYVHPDLVETYRNSEYTKNRRVVALGQPMEFNIVTTAGGQLGGKIEASGDPSNVIELTVSGPINGTDIDYIHAFLPCLQVLNLSNASIVDGDDKYHRWEVNSNGTATRYSDTYYVYPTTNDVVGDYMFYKMPQLRNIQLPKGTTAIGDYALSENTQLTVIGLSDAITTIGRSAFYRTSITEVTVPAGVTRLEEYTFHYCEKLQKAILPDGITFIGYGCFANDYELLDVNIPSSVETIDQYAFNENSKRNTPVVIPNTCKTIGNYAFRYNYAMPSVTFGNGLEKIGYAAFADCRIIEQVALPESITELGENAFYNCDSLRTFTFPQNIKQVPRWILQYCDALTSVTLADGTTSIGEAAFADCPRLTSINITPETPLTYVGNYAFDDTGITSMTLPNSITEMGYCIFQNCHQLESVNVPTGIDYVPYDYCEGCENLKSVKMHDGIRVIRHDAFLGCRTLPTIELNDQITHIEYSAFRNCDSLVINKLPTALTHIGNDAFNRTSITSANLSESITEWGTGIFANCSKLKEVKLPKNIKRITDYMFQYCSALEQIQLPDSLKEVGYAAFDWSGLTSVNLPDSLERLESYALSNTQIRSLRIPDGIRGDQPGSYVAAGCKRLKEAYLGRNQDYTTITNFTFFDNCDSLQLLRVYAGMPPKCYYYYMDYRQNCVLEVPEDAVDLYKEADVWKEFKEIRGFFQGDVLNDLDFAVLKNLYRTLDGKNWKQPWDLSNNHRSMGKWFGVLTVGDYITEIDLSGQGLQGELSDSLFLLSRIEVVNLSDNHIKADLTTLLANRAANTTLTEVNMMGNELTGDIYPFASKLPNLTKLDLSYNQLTAVSQPMSREKLDNRYFSRGFQFVDYQTKQVVEGAPVIDMTVGIPTAIESNTLQTYRHEYGDYNFTFSDLYRHFDNSTSDYELVKNSEGLWNLYTSWYNRPLRAPKGVPVIYTHGNPWWSHLTYIIRFDWKDGDANADQTVDVTDLQSIVYYALNDSKVDGQMFNFTTADVNSDEKINVSDIVGSVDYILSYVEDDLAQVPYYYNRAPASQHNVLTVDGNNIVLTHADAVAALQLTITGVALGQLRVSEALKSQFSVALREVAGGVRMVVYSAEGHALTPGIHQLLTDLPAGAEVTDVRLSDAQARHLDVTNEGGLTDIRSIMSEQLIDSEAPVFDLNGRRLGAWDTLPEGVYVIRVNGKQYKVKK